MVTGGRTLIEDSPFINMRPDEYELPEGPMIEPVRPEPGTTKL